MGLDPALIGTCLGIYGMANGILQGLLFAKFIRKFGPQRIFMSGLLSFLAIFTLFPIMSEVAQAQGLSPALWALVSVQLLFAVFADMSYGAFL